MNTTWKIAMNSALQKITVPRAGLVENPYEWFSAEVTTLALISMGFHEKHAEKLAGEHVGPARDRLNQIYLTLPSDRRIA